MSIKKYIEFGGTLTAVSGIHIGGDTDETKIGGCDNPIIKTKLDGKPYIPGSTLKGVMRSVEESRPLYKNKPNIEKGLPCGCGNSNCMVCKLFGAHMNMKAASGLPRLIVHDAYLDEAFEDELKSSGLTVSDIVDTKTSTMIDRNTNTASGGSLRNMEIISAGSVFYFKLTLKVMDGDNEAELIKAIQNNIKLVEKHGIGSKTTSGCGEVKFDIDFAHGLVTEL